MTYDERANRGFPMWVRRSMWMGNRLRADIPNLHQHPIIFDGDDARLVCCDPPKSLTPHNDP